MSEIVAPDRRRRLPGLYNFRDVGGYDVSAGRVRWGKLFRSDALHRIDDVARQRLTELGVAHVVDLRSAMELEAAPNAVDGLALTLHHLPSGVRRRMGVPFGRGARSGVRGLGTHCDRRR